MKVLLDACVLYPTVMREILLAVAGQGLFTPLWSDRILEEWARAARKLGPAGEALARGDIALVRSAWPLAAVPPAPGIEARLWLPDPHDIHVLAAAVAGSADILLTVNAQDFPRHILAEEGLTRRDPDGFLWELWSHHPAAVAGAVGQVHATAEHLSGEAQPLRKFLKKARLPRLGKALA
ncbi:MAG: PIN domain-containing protein [Rhodobacter sp.]|nr:PIN domain-containing protein [Rhodobacter sp.]